MRNLPIVHHGFYDDSLGLAVNCLRVRYLFPPPYAVALRTFTSFIEFIKLREVAAEFVPKPVSLKVVLRDTDILRVSRYVDHLSSHVTT